MKQVLLRSILVVLFGSMALSTTACSEDDTSNGGNTAAENNDTNNAGNNAPNNDNPNNDAPNNDEPNNDNPNNEPDAGNNEPGDTGDEPDVEDPMDGEDGEPDVDEPMDGGDDEPDADEPDADEPDGEDPDGELVTLVNRITQAPLDDTHSKLSHESDRFGEDTYGYSADSFVLTERTALATADFFGETILGFYRELPGFSIYILENAPNNKPNGNPNLDEALISLERIAPGQGVETILEGEDNDAYDIRVDFTAANGGQPLTLPAGEYWMVAAVYGPDAGAGDPTLSWTWRFAASVSEYTPQHLSNQFGPNPEWEPVVNNRSNTAATSMAWVMTGELLGGDDDNGDDNDDDNGQVGDPVDVVDRITQAPLDDTHSKLSHESDRFGEDTYGYSADSFVLESATTLTTADFFGETISGFYRELPGFSVYILENAPNNTPNGNPNLDEALISLERIAPGQGVETILEGEDNDAYDIRVDFTAANGGQPLTLPAGEYWLVAAVYGPDAGAGDPTLSWTWRFSSFASPYPPQYTSNQFGPNPEWEPVVNFRSNVTASAMAWTMDGVLAE